MSCVGSFLPIALEQMAREQGVLLSDRMTPCKASWVDPASSHLRLEPWGRKTSQCVVYLLGVEINTASFAMYTFSLSVLIQAFLIISVSGAADHGSYRKFYLVVFAFIGSVSIMLFLSVTSRIYVFGALLAIAANTCFGASFVLLNSFLPLLVRHNPSLLRASGQSSQTAPDASYRDRITDVNTPLLGSVASNSESAVTDPIAEAAMTDTSKALQISTRISSYGIGIGYIGAVLLQMLSILVVIATHQTTFSLRLVLFLVGLWWFIFTIPAVLWLRPRPGPPLPFSKDLRQNRSWAGYIIYAWASLGRTVLRARRLKDILLFLSAWFLLSDAIATVSGTAVLFAKTQLDMQPAALGTINVVSMTMGVIGAFSWSYVSHLLNLQASHTIIACVVLFELVPLYGLLGFVPAVKNLGYLGLQRPWEMFPLGAVFGLVIGGLSSYCRSFFGELIPPGYEAAFYALYAITDKGSSIFGPTIVGIITDWYGEIRPAFFFLAVLIFVPLPLLLLVDVERGKRDALVLATELDGQQHADPGPADGYGTVPHIQLIDEDPEEPNGTA